MDETGDKSINNRFSYNDAADHGVHIQYKSMHLQNLCPWHFHPNFHKIHIGHISVMFKSHAHLEKTALYRNRKHPHIKFIFEHECSTPALFLDIKIWRENNKLKTSMYRKQYLVKFSLISAIYKYGFVYLILNRCFSVSSSNQKFNDEIYLLKEMFKPDRYPIQFIDRYSFLQQSMHLRLFKILSIKKYYPEFYC